MWQLSCWIRPPLPDGCRVHLGHAADHGHLLVEHSLEVQPGQGVNWMQEAEVGARFATMALARRLMEEHPAFSGARVTEMAHDLTLPPLWRVSPADSALLVAGGCQGQFGDEAARTDHIRCCQASSDHGAMPELCYLLYSLAMARCGEREPPEGPSESLTKLGSVEGIPPQIPGTLQAVCGKPWRIAENWGQSGP